MAGLSRKVPRYIAALGILLYDGASPSCQITQLFDGRRLADTSWPYYISVASWATEKVTEIIARMEFRLDLLTVHCLSNIRAQHYIESFFPACIPCTKLFIIG